MAPSNETGVKELEFETWASDDDLRVFAAAMADRKSVGSRRMQRDIRPRGCQGAGFPDDGCIKEEVRRKWAAFRYFASHGLTSKAGFARAFEHGLEIDLPATRFR